MCILISCLHQKPADLYKFTNLSKYTVFKRGYSILKMCVHHALSMYNMVQVLHSTSLEVLQIDFA